MTDLTTRLRELADLHNAGELTDAEYEKAKAVVIGDGGSVPSARRAAPDRPSPSRAASVAGQSATAPLIGVPLEIYEAALGARPFATSIDKLAARTGASPAQVGRVLDQLEQHGHLQLQRLDDGAIKARPGATRPTGGVGPGIGGWWIVVLVFGFVGGLIGFFSVRSQEPARADAILKWGLVCSLTVWTLLWLLVAAS